MGTHLERADSDTHSTLVDHIEGYLSLNDCHVLDLGSGTGGIARALSERCQQLTVSDIDEDSVRNSLNRTVGEHTYGCRLHAGALPFDGDTFDVVVVNGVLEWVPDARNEPPRRQQLDALREIHRVLRPEGVLYLGIETRFYAPYLVGLRDHSGLPFASVLPRPVAHVYSQLVRGRQYGNYLYTPGGYQELLSAAGFTDIDLAAALPSYKRPQRIVPFDRPTDIRQSISEIDEPGWRRAVRKLLALHPKLFENFGTEVVIVARPSAA